MKPILIIIGLLANLPWVMATSTATSTQIQPLQTLTLSTQPNTPADRIRHQYNLFCTKLNNSNTSLHDIYTSILSLENCLSPAFPIDNFAERTVGLDGILSSLGDNIVKFLRQEYLGNTPRMKSQYESLLSPILEESTNLVRFIKLMNSPHVSMGGICNSRIPENFRNTIRSCVGRIFVIKDDTVTDYASGMIAPYQENRTDLYDQVITCAHSMLPNDKDPTLEFYFVRDEHLDSWTGLPLLEEICNTLCQPVAQGEATIGNLKLAKYLRKKCNQEQNVVRRIVRFTPFSCHAHRATSVLSDHSPRYHPHQDIGIAHLGTSFHFSQPLLPIKISKNHISPQSYFAIGYPRLTHWSTRNDSKLIQEMKRAPFTVSCSSASSAQIAYNNDNLMVHGALTAPGMSGGPILTFQESGIPMIIILGVIASGDANNNYACKFW